MAEYKTLFFKKRDVIALKRQYIYCALLWHNVYCCVIRRLVTSAGSDGTQNYKRIGKSPKYGFSFSKQSKTENNIFSRFWIFFPGSTLKKFSLTFCPNFFNDSTTCIVTLKKILGQKVNVKFFTVAPYVEVT